MCHTVLDGQYGGSATASGQLVVVVGGGVESRPSPQQHSWVSRCSGEPQSDAAALGPMPSGADVCAERASMIRLLSHNNYCYYPRSTFSFKRLGLIPENPRDGCVEVRKK